MSLSWNTRNPFKMTWGEKLGFIVYGLLALTAVWLAVFGILYTIFVN